MTAQTRGWGAARKPKKFAAGGKVEPTPSPGIGARIRKAFGMETQAEKATQRKTKLDQAEKDALK